MRIRSYRKNTAFTTCKKQFLVTEVSKNDSIKSLNPRIDCEFFYCAYYFVSLTKIMSEIKFKERKDIIENKVGFEMEINFLNLNQSNFH